MLARDPTLTRIRRLWQLWAILGLFVTPFTVGLPTTWFGPVWLWGVLLPGVCALFARVLEAPPAATARITRRPTGGRRARPRRRAVDGPKPQARRRVGLPFDRAVG